MKLTLYEFRDKVKACWLGKNAGGTLGAPFECRRGVFDVSFYTQDLQGEPLPNDDLDLQIIWLNAVEKYGRFVSSSILGEYWHKVPIDVLGRGIDCPTNYPFTDAILKFIAYGRGEEFATRIYNILEIYPQKTIDTMFNSLDTHDMVRALTILSMKLVRDNPDRIWEIDKEGSPWHVGDRFLTDEFRKFEFDNDKLEGEDYENAKRRLKLAVILQYFLPGIPCIFYGTEVGIHGYKDPFNRKCFNWDESTWDKDLLKFYQEIGKFRKLYYGGESQFDILYADQDVVCFTRANKENSVFVAINRGDQRRDIDIPQYFKERGRKFTLNAGENYLEPMGGIIILK